MVLAPKVLKRRLLRLLTLDTNLYSSGKYKTRSKSLSTSLRESALHICFNRVVLPDPARQYMTRSDALARLIALLEKNQLFYVLYSHFNPKTTISESLHCLHFILDITWLRGRWLLKYSYRFIYSAFTFGPSPSLNRRYSSYTCSLRSESCGWSSVSGTCSCG